MNVRVSKKIDIGRNLFVLVDDSDYDHLSNFIWYASSRRDLFEAEATIKGKKTKMHRLILSAVSGEQVDHLNGNTLDNRRLNLKKVSWSEQQMNKVAWAKSGYKGVYSNGGNSWSAVIFDKGKSVRLGSFPSKEEAYLVYCQEHLKRRGYPVRTNVVRHIAGEKKERKDYRRRLSKYSGERYISFCKTYKKWIVCVPGIKREWFDDLKVAIKKKEVLCKLEKQN